MIEWLPFVSVVDVMVVVELLHTHVHKTTFPLPYKVTVFPFSAQAISNVGVTSFVILSFENTPESDAACRSGSQGADGGIVS